MQQLKLLWMLLQVVDSVLSRNHFLEVLQITLESGILYPFRENGDTLMADSGLTVREYTVVLNIELIIPAFLKGKD